MGSSHSTPPPLVRVSSPRGKVLIPPGTAFAVHPSPSYSPSQLGPYPRSATGPVYAPYARERGRGKRGHDTLGYGYGAGGTDIDITEETSRDGEKTLGDVVVDAEIRRRKEGLKGSLTKGMSTMGPGGVFGQLDLDTLGSRPRSRAEIPGRGGYAGVPVGVAASGIGSSQQPSGLPPEYTSNPDLVGYGEDGIMPGTGLVSPYPTYPPSPLASSSPPLSNGALPPQPVPRGRPKHYEHVAMGAYTDTNKARNPPRSHVDAQTSTRLDHGQSSGKKVGPSGQEWLDGGAFFDASICTIDCKCRKSQRVLYHACEDRRNNGSGTNMEDHEYVCEEIGYILEDDLGWNCDDDTGCQASESSSDWQDRRRGKSTNKNKNKSGDRRGRGRLQQPFQGFKDDVLEALDERLDGMRKEGRQRHRGHNPARLASPGASGSGQSLYYMANGPHVDARMAGQMGMSSYNLYGVAPSGIGPMPHGITSSGLAAAGMRRHGDDISDMTDMTDMEFDNSAISMMHNGYMQPHMTMLKRETSKTKKAMRPNSTSHHGAKAGERQDMGTVEGNRSMAVDPQALLGRHGNRYRYRSSSSGSVKGRGRGRLGSREKDTANKGNLGGSVVSKGTESSGKGGRQARADTDDEGEDKG